MLNKDDWDRKKWDPDKPGRALVACWKGWGLVLYYVGHDLATEMNLHGPYLDDVGLPEPVTDGLWVWEGKVKYMLLSPDSIEETELVEFEGEYRRPNEEELPRIVQGVTPWDERGWLLPTEP